MEKGQWGHYDYGFINDSDAPLEISLGEKGCDCSHVRVCTLSPDAVKKHHERQDEEKYWRRSSAPVDENFSWTELSEKSAKAYVVPPRQGGLLRLTWQARKDPGEQLNLGFDLWIQPEGAPYQRSLRKVIAGVVIRAPVVFDKGTLDIGVLEAGRSAERDFHCWSATRDRFDLVLPKEGEHPCRRCP
jgi:hypothetical protein